MARTPTLPPNDPRMWRRLVALTHPDAAGGSHELFIWATAMRVVVCGGELGTEIPRRERGERAGANTEPSAHPSRRREASTDDRERVPFDPFADFASLTDRALHMAAAVAEPYGYLLRQLADCHPVHEGTLYDQQRRGATYKQLAAIGHRVGMSSSERAQWYDVCWSIPLSQRHAGHILSRLKKRAA